jgi:S-adenosylmethionine synthetase
MRRCNQCFTEEFRVLLKSERVLYQKLFKEEPVFSLPQFGTDMRVISRAKPSQRMEYRVFDYGVMAAVTKTSRIPLTI